MYNFKIGDKVCKDFCPGIIEDIVEIPELDNEKHLKIKGWLGLYKMKNFEPYEKSIKNIKSIIRSYENQIKIIEKLE